MVENIISVWANELMKDSAHLPVLKWSAALSEVDQEIVIKMRPLAITWPEDIDEDDAANTEELEKLMDALT